MLTDCVRVSPPDRRCRENSSVALYHPCEVAMTARMLGRRLRVCAALLVQTSVALHLPSAHLLATTARDACAALGVSKDEWLEPEDAASAVARALSAISLPAAEAEGDAPAELPPLPPQGEFVFSTDVHADRYAEAEEAAFGGDARAQHTLGLLLWGGVGGVALGLGLGLGLGLLEP